MSVLGVGPSNTKSSNVSIIHHFALGFGVDKKVVRFEPWVTKYSLPSLSRSDDGVTPTDTGDQQSFARRQISV